MGSSSSGKTSKAETFSFLSILKRTSSHVFPSPQSHSSTVSSDGISGSRAAKSTRRRICLESRGWLPVPRWATTAQFRASSRKGATREGAGGPVHPRTWMGTFLYEQWQQLLVYSPVLHSSLDIIKLVY